MARLEYKYYIHFRDLDNLRRDVQPFLEYDTFTNVNTKKEYTVRSVYLDSFKRLAYHEKSDGLRIRKKFRIRGYNELADDSHVFLEIKRKDSDYISKDRAPLLYCELQKFFETRDLSYILSLKNDALKRKDNARNFLYYFFLHNLKPYVVVSYEREAYECKFGSGLRVTFDKNVRTRETKSFSDLFSNNNMIPSMKKYFVLEVKFHRVLPGWLPSILKKYNIIRESVPKYSLSVDAVKENRFSISSN